MAPKIEAGGSEEEEGALDKPLLYPLTCVASPEKVGLFLFPVFGGHFPTNCLPIE
jgi:hypothetical protein